MKLTKKTLATAVAATLFSTGAFAVVDIDVSSPGTAVYAKELKIPTTGLDLTDAGTALDVTGKLSSSFILANNAVILKFTLSNGAAFTQNIVAADLTAPAGTKTVQDGLAGDNSVEILYTPTNNTVATDSFTLAIPGVEVLNDSAVTVSYEIKNATTGAVLKTKSAALLEFQKALTFTCAAGNPSKVDVTKGLKVFSGLTPTTSTQGTVQLAFTPRLDANSAQLTNAADILTGGTLKLSNANGWAAFVPAGGSVKIGADALTVDGKDATNDYLAGAAANLGNPATGLVALGTAQSVVLTLSNAADTLIDTGSITAEFESTAGNAYNVVTGSCNDLSPIVKDGSDASLDFLTGTSSSYPSYIRITNPSSINGTVYLTITDDAGEKAELKLSDFGLSEELAKGTSTGNLKVSDVAAKAAEANPAFNATTSRYRVVANGEFSNIKMQAWAVANDGTSFELLK